MTVTVNTHTIAVFGAVASGTTAGINFAAGSATLVLVANGDNTNPSLAVSSVTDSKGNVYRKLKAIPVAEVAPLANCSLEVWWTPAVPAAQSAVTVTVAFAAAQTFVVGVVNAAAAAKIRIDAEGPGFGGTTVSNVIGDTCTPSEPNDLVLLFMSTAQNDADTAVAPDTLIDQLQGVFGHGTSTSSANGAEAQRAPASPGSVTLQISIAITTINGAAWALALTDVAPPPAPPTAFVFGASDTPVANAVFV